MRPSYADVRQWFAAGAVTDSLLASYLTLLLNDPNWYVLDHASGPLRSLSLLYYPTGAPRCRARSDRRRLASAPLTPPPSSVDI